MNGANQIQCEPLRRWRRMSLDEADEAGGTPLAERKEADADGLPEPLPKLGTNGP
jgi:hypothetical protein